MVVVRCVFGSLDGAAIMRAGGCREGAKERAVVTRPFDGASNGDGSRPSIGHELTRDRLLAYGKPVQVTCGVIGL
jgi:hypothetical protein